MMGVDHLLAERAREARPIRVAMAGCGSIGVGLVRQIVNSVPGMRLAAIAVRNPDQAIRALGDAGVQDVAIASNVGALNRALRCDIPAVTEDFESIAKADGIDVVIDATGAVEFGCQLAMTCFGNGKHLVQMNAVVDATVGAELGRQADAAGVVYTGCGGDQPGAQLDLIRFVHSIGVQPLVSGSIKGLQDPWTVTSFADGTKVSVEQTIVANATGMSLHRRGMLGRDHAGHVDELTERYDVEELRALGGAVDYVVGADPYRGVYCFGTHHDPKQRRYLELYKRGKGPLYSFYTPYQLCHFEVPITAARAVLMGDATVRALSTRNVEAVATAKVDLEPGTVLDGLGGCHYYGEAEMAHVARQERLLPVGAAEGCRIARPVAKDATITYDDVVLPPGRLVDQLLEAQGRLPVGMPPGLLLETTRGA